MPAGMPASFAVRGPRPKSPIGSVLIIAGAALLVLAAYLPWYKDGNGVTYTGMDSFARHLGADTFEGPGKVWVGIGVIVGGLGIAAFFAGRQVALAIVTLVFAAIGALISLIGVGVASDQKKYDELFGNPGSTKIGAILGVSGALLVARLLRPLLYDVPPYDPSLYGAVLLSFFAVALLATVGPAQHAAKIDPAAILRSE